MARLLVILALILALFVCVWIVFGVIAERAWERAGKEPWPEGLEPLEQVEDLYPPHGDSAAASRLADFARPLGLHFEPKAQQPAELKPFGEYVTAQVANPRVAIAEPPADLATYLAQHDRTIDAVRGHLLEQGRGIAWRVDLTQGFDAPIPNLLAHLHLARILVARALVRARAGEAGAWDDLHAASELAALLERRPDQFSQLIALSVRRMVNAAAWKFPLPAPAWLNTPPDSRRAFLTGIRNATWSLWKNASFSQVTRVYERMALANYVDHERETARQLAAVTGCAFDDKAFTERRRLDFPRWNRIGRGVMFNAGWGRVMRLQAEREATANALRVRSGQPIVERSQCSDGTWRYENGTLAFSVDMPASGKQTPMPLTLVELAADHAAAGDH